MVITFCGHADFVEKPNDEQLVLRFLEEAGGGQGIDFYLGDYGGFDAFAYRCCKKYQQVNRDCKLVFVTPYLNRSSKRSIYGLQERLYDEVLYPELESVPPRFAILRRNQWMVEHADAVVAYIDHSWGGAYQSYQYARRRKRAIWNLAELGKGEEAYP